MKTLLPRVLILHTGGTLGMDLREGHKNGEDMLAVPQLSPQLLKKRFLERVPEIQRLARCEVEVLMNRDSSHIGPDEWRLIAQTIRKKWSAYDGIVLLHGTDTLAYTASALSFLLRPCLKPVVITGAQRPLAALRTDAKTNLISAVEIAAHGPRKLVNQITVFFGDKLFQGNRVRKKSASDFAAFESPHSPPLAIVGTTIRYGEPTASKRKKAPPLEAEFSRKILTLHLTPSFPSLSLTQAALPYLEGIVLVVFHSWTAPTHDPAFLQFLKAARKLKLPITIVTDGSAQSPGNEKNSPTGNRSLRYEAGKELISLGCLPAGRMTVESAFIKTALLLGHSRDLERFQYLWEMDFAGEGIS